MAAMALLAACSAVPGPSPTSALAPAWSPPLALDAARCTALGGHRVPSEAIALPTGGAAVSSATWVAAAPEQHGAAASTQAVVAYCRVLAEIQPRDGQAPAIRMQLNVPGGWTGGVIQVGGGGLNGSIPANLAVLAGGGSPISGAQPPDAPYPINRGYAMFGGDSGHQGDAGHWALNDEARENFGHAALKKTHDAAFALLHALFGQRPRVSYFMGQSQGGREALEVAQRYPDDYDGVVATAPLIGYVPHVLHKTLLAAAQTGAAWISPAKAKTVGAEVLRQCDALDGLADGVIGNTLGCQARFDDTTLRCPGGADAGEHCLSDAQLGTLRLMHAPLRLPYPLTNGLTETPGYGWGREAQPGWLNTVPQPVAGTPPALGQPGTTVQFAVLRDPAADLLALSLTQARERIVSASALLDSTNPALDRFFRRGGKLIVKANGSDYAVNAQTLARWVDQVQARVGEATLQAQMRFYLVPNVGHGGEGSSASTGAPIPHAVDLVSMMTDWVERNASPPEVPVLRAVSRKAPYAVSASQPLCRYPLYPQYLGGDARLATSFACTAPVSHRRELLADGDRRIDVRVDVQQGMQQGRRPDGSTAGSVAGGIASAAPPLVLLPSSLRDSLDFDDLAQRLARRGYLVLRPQPRGMGHSSPPPPGMTLDTLASDVALAVQRLAGGRPAVLVGHAYGHWVARVADMNHPALVRGVVVLGGSAKVFPAGAADALALASDPTQAEATRIAALQQVMFAPGNDPRPWLDGWHPQWRAAYRQAGQQPPKDLWFGRANAPILDLQGALDPWRPPASRNELRDLLPDKVSVRVIAGASHAMVPERPAEITDAIDEWVRGLR